MQMIMVESNKKKSLSNRRGIFLYQQEYIIKIDKDHQDH